MKLANATNLDRKSGRAEWRDLLCAFPPNDSQMHSTLHGCHLACNFNHKATL